MDELSLILGLILGAVGVLMIQSFIKARLEKIEKQKEAKNENGAQDEEIAHLKDRIAVMERITTDRGVRTAEEIESLR